MIRTTPTTRTVLDLVRAVEEDRLVLRPPYQRRTVWTPAVKDNFLDTVVRGLPFPEIFIVTGHTDPAARVQVDHLVDGQQRVSALREYLNDSPFIKYNRVPRYSMLSKKQQSDFLSYVVAVRHLAGADDAAVRDIFQRINSTDYALKATERFNARYTGAYRDFCEKLAGHSFFKNHKTFSEAVWKRMGDLTFTLTLVTTLLAGYFRREELLGEYLGRYNDSFPDQESVTSQLEDAFRFVDACHFSEPPRGKCRVWKTTDLFTLLVEACFLIRTGKAELDPKTAGPRLTAFYDAVDALYRTDAAGETGDARSVPAQVLRYMKAATKATNDKYARVDRAEVIAPLLIGEPTQSKPKRKRKGT